MEKLISKRVILLLSLILLCSCAAQKRAKEKVEQKIKSEAVVKQLDVDQNAREYIAKSESLSELQKRSLLELRDKTTTESKKLEEEVNKSKMVLIKTILQPKVDEKEVFILRKKIKKLYKKMMDLDFKSFDEARKVIDPLKEVRDREFLYNSFMMRHDYYW